MIPAELVKEKMNKAGASQAPFLFGVDFELTEGFFYEQPLRQQEVLWNIRGTSNATVQATSKSFSFFRHPESYSAYQQKFDIVRHGLLRGDSFLLNLTTATAIDTDLSLYDIFCNSTAPYRLLVPGQFVCFSPETFVRINGREIASFPMKGTIHTSVPLAEQVILNDYKEKAEHYTIVDLIRNDLNRIAGNVYVKRFRYIDRLKTSNGDILQVSSEIAGQLPEDYCSRIGDIIFDLLPAGSISGAPKTSTINIIRQAEQEPRGFYTGIFGYFDGQNLDSAVLIRFIEQQDNAFRFRSGGGITINSRCEDEYREVLEKVYLPFR